MTEQLIDVPAFRKAVDALPADALSAVRAAAADTFSDVTFPFVKTEDWKYTSLNNAARISNAWLATPLADSTDQGETPAVVGEIDACWLVLRNGLLQEPVPDLPEGVSLRRLTKESGDATIITNDPLSAFNAALLRDALYLQVDANTVIEKPIGLLILDSVGNSPQVTQYRILMDIGTGASADIIEAHYSSGSDDSFSNSVAQLKIASHATVNYVRFQNRSRTHESVNRLTTSIANNASLRHAAYDLGGAMVRNDIAVSLEGVGAEVALTGLYLAGDNQHIDNHTRIDHKVGPGKSTEEYRGILHDQARCVFNGKAIVHAGADGTDAQQANHNLLLSGEAEIDTKPELEIYADDVKCSHGATTGQLDETALFYLRTRGLDPDTATRLMTRAFASGLLAKIPVTAANTYVRNEIDTRLDTLIGANPGE